MLLNYFKYHDVPRLPGYQTIEPPYGGDEKGLRVSCLGYEVMVTLNREHRVLVGQVNVSNYNFALYGQADMYPRNRYGTRLHTLWQGHLEATNAMEGLLEAYTKAYATPFRDMRQKLAKGCGEKQPYDHSTWLPGANFQLKRLDSVKLYIGFTVWGCPLLAGLDPCKSNFYIRGRTHEGDVVEKRFEYATMAIKHLSELFRENRMEGQQ